MKSVALYGSVGPAPDPTMTPEPWALCQVLPWRASQPRAKRARNTPEPWALCQVLSWRASQPRAKRARNIRDDFLFSKD
jgi:hypothetical protein